MNINGVGGKRFEPGNSAGLATRWQRGQSGNPAGKSKLQREFEETLGDALAGENPHEQAKELATVVWAAARKGEAWAVQLLFTRLAPEPLRVKMEVSRGDDEIDFSRLTDEQIDQLEQIYMQVAGPAGLLESRESSAEPV
jgi:hypothetical protein